jgi:hypothetical protein
METEHRRSPRVPFVAAAEVIELDSEVRLRARTCDLSQHGCYLDMINPLPAGTTVKIQIAQGEQTFDAFAGVVYSQTPLGMGVEFRELPSDRRLLLEQWVSDPERLLT